MPEGLLITVPQQAGRRQRIEVVLTRAQWDDYALMIHGTADPRATPFKETVLGALGRARFLVHQNHGWVASDTREPPEDEPPAGPGHWVPG